MPVEAKLKSSRAISENQSVIDQVKIQNQVDSSNQATIDSQVLISGNSASENPHSEGNTNSFAYSEDSNSDSFTSDSNESNKSNELNNSNESGEGEPSNCAGLQTSVLLSLPYSILSEEQLNSSVDNFIQETSSVHFIRAQELLDCKANLSYNLAVKTIKGIKKNEESGWVLIGIAAYRIWNNTSALAGGAGKTAGADEGRMNALANLAADCTANGKKIATSTLYDYVRRIKVLLEEPLEALAGQNEKTIRRERTVLMEKLFLLPSSFARAAVSTKKPLEALEIACQLRAEKRDEQFKGTDFKKAIAHLKNNDDAAVNNDARPDGEAYNDNLESSALTIAPKQIVTSKGDQAVCFEQTFSAQINREAKRANLDPEQIKNLYVSFLQTILITVQDMGVAK